MEYFSNIVFISDFAKKNFIVDKRQCRGYIISTKYKNIEMYSTIKFINLCIENLNLVSSSKQIYIYVKNIDSNFQLCKFFCQNIFCGINFKCKQENIYFFYISHTTLRDIKLYYIVYCTPMCNVYCT